MGQELIGLSACVTADISGNGSPGKAMVAGVEFVAVSKKRIAVGQMVEIVGVPAPKTLEVRWRRWLN